MSISARDTPRLTEFLSKRSSTKRVFAKALCKAVVSQRKRRYRSGHLLSDEVRTKVPIETLMRYFVRREYDDGQSLYAQGDPAETIDIVASGSVDTVHQAQSGATTLRKMKTRTVIGEMGFFRHRPRAASVLTRGRTVLYTLDRKAYEDMISNDPGLALDFQAFIIRSLSDRVEFANREVSALI